MKKKFLIKGLVIFLLVIISVPFLMYIFVDQCDFGNNNIDQSVWLSFWGTYIGACIGGIITYVSLISSVLQYQEAAQQTRRDFVETQNEEKSKYIFQIRRDILTSARPLLIIEPVNVYDKKPVEKVERYVYGVTESQDEWADISNYNMEKQIRFKVKNIGEGPAENVHIEYASSVYHISGFNDKSIKERKEKAPILFQKMSFDIPHNDYVNVNITFHFSKKMVEMNRIYMHEMSFDLVFSDCRNNEIRRTITVDLVNENIVGWDSQRYSLQDNQEIFDGVFKFSV